MSSIFAVLAIAGLRRFQGQKSDGRINENSEAEYLEARANLARVHWNVDYIISHCCPSSIQDVFSGGMFKKDALTEFFDEVRQKCTFQYWFFGHYHSNMVIEKRYAMLYEQIIRLK